VSQHDPTDPGHWSGTPYFLMTALQRSVDHVHVVAPLRTPLGTFLKGLAKVHNQIFSKQYHFAWNRAVARGLASVANRQIGADDFDFVLSMSSVIGAYLDTDAPLVTWEDSTIAGMLGYYSGAYAAISRASVENSRFLQQRSLDRATLSVFSSEWAARGAVEHYGADPAKIRVIPFGANLECPPSLATIDSALVSRMRSSECRLLFVGVEWERKGGETVLRTAEILHRSGVRVVVDIVGIRPPCSVPNYVRVHGYVSKASIEGRKLLENMLLSAHYLFVPSIAECYGLVYAEASAFGVPSLSRRTGGIPSVVIDGENGWLLPPDGPAEAYAELIRNGIANPELYSAMSRRARQLYDERFNWKVAIDALKREVANRVAMPSCCIAVG